MAYANRKARKVAADIAQRISDRFAPDGVSIYLSGSVVLDDFREGWSDIDMLCLSARPVSRECAQELLTLRQRLCRETGNPLYRSVEGAILPLEAFVHNAPATVVYWGTSGESIREHYSFDSFSMRLLMDRGELLTGTEVRGKMQAPCGAALREDVARHLAAIRRYAAETDESLYSYGWLLDIARCLWTLKMGGVAAKTAAGRWALEQNLCPVPEALEAALRVREQPDCFKNDAKVRSYARTLGLPIQRFADVLERALER